MRELRGVPVCGQNVSMRVYVLLVCCVHAQRRSCFQTRTCVLFLYVFMYSTRYELASCLLQGLSLPLADPCHAFRCRILRASLSCPALLTENGVPSSCQNRKRISQINFPCIFYLLSLTESGVTSPYRLTHMSPHHLCLSFLLAFVV